MKGISVTKNQVSCKGAVIVLILLCVPGFVLTVQAQSGGGYEIISGEFGISGESSGSGYSQVDSVFVTDGNEMSGYEIISGEFGISGESSGGGYSQVGSVLVTDGNEMSGGGFSMTEESVLATIDCVIGFEDFARFAVYWLQTGSDLPADLYLDNYVNTADLLEFVNWWLCFCPSNWPLR